MSQLLMQKQTVKEYVIQYSACERRWMLSAWYTHTFLHHKCEIKQVALRATELIKTFFLHWKCHGRAASVAEKVWMLYRKLYLAQTILSAFFWLNSEV